MIRLASILIVLVLAVLAAAGYPVFAQEPPEQEGKQASIVDPLIQQFIDRQGSATPQPSPQPDSSAFTRGLAADADQDNVYEITVVASDGSNEGTLDVTVTVTEVNEGPEVTGQTARTVGENFDQVLATY